MASPTSSVPSGFLSRLQRLRLSEFLRRARTITARILRFSARPFIWYAEAIQSKPTLAIVLLLLALACSAWSMAWLLHRFQPKPLITVSAFEVPSSAEKLGVNGRTLANLLVDELHEIVEGAKAFKGSELSSALQYGQVPRMPHIPVQTTFGIEYKGISIDQLVQAWDNVRYEQQRASGDLILTADGGGFLRLRMNSGDQERHWQRHIPTVDAAAFQGALHQLAAEMLLSMNPEALGRYYLSQEVACGTHACKEQIGKEAADVFRIWIRREPTKPAPFFYLAYALSMFDPNDAQIAVERSLQIDPEFDRAAGLESFLFDRDRKHDESDALDRMLVKKHPDKPMYLVNAGQGFRQHKQYSDALRYYEKAIAIDPAYAAAITYSGDCLEALNRKEEAKKAYWTAIRVQPDFTPAIDRLSELLRNEGHSDEALRQYKFALLLNPESWELQKGLGWLYLEDGNLSSAKALLAKAALQTDDAGLWNNLGVTLEGAGAIQEAKRCYRKAVESDSSDELARKNLARLERLGETAAPYDDAGLWNNLGLTLEKTGDVNRAAQCYQRALESDPNNEVAKRNVARLQALGVQPGDSSTGSPKP